MSDTTCQHNSYWKTTFGNCMACRAEKAEAKLNIAREYLSKIRFGPVCDEPYGTVLSLQEIAQEALDKIK